MRRRTVLGLGLALFVSSVGRLWGEENLSQHGLIPRLNWAQFRVHRGRIQAQRPRFLSAKSQTHDDQQLGVRESLSLSVDANSPSLVYELIEPRQRLCIQFIGGSQLVICREPRGESAAPRVAFTQPAEGRLSLVIDDGRHPPKTATAASFWHLMLMRPEDCRRHLIPILENLRPDWHLGEQAGRVEDALFRLTAAGWSPNRRQWQHWVQQLGSDDFRTRRAADRELRRAGQAVLAFLDNLPREDLDAEQRMRIRAIRDSLVIDGGDEPDRVATWLIDDKQVWLNLLSHASADRRTLALGQLERLCQRELPFDPHADGNQRQQQIARLARSLAD